MYSQEVYRDENCQLSLEIENDGSIRIHCNMQKLTAKNYDYYIMVLGELLEELKAKGAERLFAIAPDDKVMKFAEMFGFTHIGYHPEYKMHLLQVEVQ